LIPVSQESWALLLGDGVRRGKDNRGSLKRLLFFPGVFFLFIVVPLEMIAVLWALSSCCHPFKIWYWRN